MYILIAGVKYGCTDDEECQALLRRLDEERPKILLVSERSAGYGIVVRALQGKSKCGVVCRFDLDAVLRHMARTDDDVLVARVESVNLEGGYYTVSADVDEEKSEREEPQCTALWSDWSWTGAPLLSLLPGETDTQQSLKVLRSAIRHPELLTDEEVADYLELLIETSYWDVCEETQCGFNELRLWLIHHRSPLLRSYYDRLVHAILSQGSQKRRVAFGEKYYQLLADGEAAREMIDTWWSSRMLAPNKGLDEQMMVWQQLRAIDDSLKQLPEKLYDNTRDFGHLMNRLLYLHTPRKKLVMVLSALLLRDRLESYQKSAMKGRGESVVTSASADAAALLMPEERLVAQLTPLFYDEHDVAQSFVAEVRNAKPKEITRTVNRYLKAHTLMPTSAHRELWTILHDVNLYPCSESNWNKQVG